ncbi:SMI1/KNR4 family protein [Streptomyces sp. NPDC047981]|uniref:SMI1/KNR4 family protein n=1 Tax=Streptomyces sp. NPDC047981 TaxID=3154610 RepID=UPI00343B2E69
MDVRPFSVAEWRVFLHDYSAKFLDDSRLLRTLEENGAGAYVRSHVRREGWIGNESANADVVGAAEERLGTRLPLSYRNFLMASDGFCYVDHIDLLRVDEIGWLAERDPELVEVWSLGDESYREMLEQSLLSEARLPSVASASSWARWRRRWDISDRLHHRPCHQRDAGARSDLR